jgi:hypothetical protein
MGRSFLPPVLAQDSEFQTAPGPVVQAIKAACNRRPHCRRRPGRQCRRIGATGTASDLVELLILCGTYAVRHCGTTSPQRPGWANRRVACSLVLHFGVKLCPDQDDKG